MLWDDVMSVSGSLKTMELPFLMQWCKNSGQTGTLILSRDAMRKEVHFEKGYIASSGSNDPRE